MKTQHSKPAGSKSHPSPHASTIPRDFPAPICGALAEVIREEREARGLSCFAVAKLAGLARETVSIVERKRSLRKFDTAARIADVFGLKLAQLVAQAERRC